MACQTLDKLPSDIISNIISHLPFDDLKRFRQVNRLAEREGFFAFAKRYRGLRFLVTENCDHPQTTRLHGSQKPVLSLPISQLLKVVQRSQDLADAVRVLVLHFDKTPSPSNAWMSTGNFHYEGTRGKSPLACIMNIFSDLVELALDSLDSQTFARYLSHLREQEEPEWQDYHPERQSLTLEGDAEANYGKKTAAADARYAHERQQDAHQLSKQLSSLRLTCPRIITFGLSGTYLRLEDLLALRNAWSPTLRDLRLRSICVADQDCKWPIALGKYSNGMSTLEEIIIRRSRARHWTI